MSASVFEDIVASSSRRAASLAGQTVALRSSAASAARRRSPFSFRKALMTVDSRARVIAEIKAASPSAGVLLTAPPVERIAAEYERGGATAISIVTEPEFFHGSHTWIARASSSGLPILMKDFVVSAAQLFAAIAAGADAVLLLASILDREVIREFLTILEDHGCDAVVEAHDSVEVAKAVAAGAAIIGINNRNLRDFSVSLDTATTLSSKIPAGIVRIAESGIRTPDHIRELAASGFDAFLVGESILRQADREAAVSRLVRSFEAARC